MKAKEASTEVNSDREAREWRSYRPHFKELSEYRGKKIEPPRGGNVSMGKKSGFTSPGLNDK